MRKEWNNRNDGDEINNEEMVFNGRNYVNVGRSGGRDL